jgi:hypothetical protein
MCITAPLLPGLASPPLPAKPPESPLRARRARIWIPILVPRAYPWESTLKSIRSWPDSVKDNLSLPQIDADEILIFTVDCIVMDRQYSPHTCRFAAGNLQIKIIYRRPPLLRSYPNLICGKKVCLAVEWNE